MSDLIEIFNPEPVYVVVTPPATFQTVISPPEVVESVVSDDPDIHVEVVPGGMQGPKGETGDQGPQGLPGADGVDGVDGLNGLNGADGADGSDGSPRLLSGTLTTSVLAPGESFISTIPLGKSYRLLSMTVSEISRVRLYATTEGVLSDLTRPATVDPPDGLGVIFDYVTTRADTFILSPTVDGSNMNAPVTVDIPISIVNLSENTTSISVSFVFQTTEL